MYKTMNAASQLDHNPVRGSVVYILKLPIPVMRVQVFKMVPNSVIQRLMGTIRPVTKTLNLPRILKVNRA